MTPGTPRGSRLLEVGLAALAALASIACHREPASPSRPPETREACLARQQALVSYVSALPSQTVASTTRLDLPVSTLGQPPGRGPVLQVTANGVAIDETPLGAVASAESVDAFRRWLAGWAHPPAAARAERPALYVAAAADVDVQSLRALLTHVPGDVALRLLVRTPPRTASRAAEDETRAARDLSTRLLFEPDPRERERVATEAYGAFASCAPVTEAAARVRGKNPHERWPALQAELTRALPQCECSKLDTTRLRALVSTEQRAGAATLGWVPLSFLRDERCGASMPLRSIGKLLQQVSGFDEEFSGDYAQDAVKFDDVLTNERLRVYFCNALPGETFAARARAKATLFIKAPGGTGCEGWQLEPSSPGAPMGTWRRAAAPGHSPLAYHYWQAAEELRVFGPVDPGAASKPTDEREWPCEETHRLVDIDEDSLRVEKGRWFFSEAACRAAPQDAAPAPLCTRAKEEVEADVSPPPPHPPNDAAEGAQKPAGIRR